MNNTQMKNEVPQPPPLSLDGAMMILLSTAEKHGRNMLAVPMEGFPNVVMQQALTMMVADDQLRLLDVCMMPSERNKVVLHRIFRMTGDGKQKLAMLRVSAK